MNEALLNTARVAALLVGGMGWLGLASADEPLVGGTARRCFLAGGAIDIDLAVRAAEGEPVSVDYRLGSPDRIVARGTANLRVEEIAGERLVRLPLVLDDIELRTITTLAFGATLAFDGQEQQHERTLHLYPMDPQVPLEFSYDDLGLRLFDPAGKTAKLLDEEKIPFTRLRTVDSIDGVSDGVLVIGEGVSLTSQRSLSRAMVAAARRGLRVVCLAPAAGTFEVPLNADQAAPSRMSLADRGWARGYDKRFDLLPAGVAFDLKSDAKRLALAFSDDSPSTVWGGATFVFSNAAAGDGDDSNAGSIEVGGVRLLDHWHTSPVPRYLLAYQLHSPVSRSHDEENDE